MEYLLISTPLSRNPGHLIPSQAEGNADLRTQVFATTPCSISLSSHLPRRMTAVGQLDERKKQSTKNPNRGFRFSRVRALLQRFGCSAADGQALALGETPQFVQTG
jgi:hypothetical protein